jgi:hypothetical protein
MAGCFYSHEDHMESTKQTPSETLLININGEEKTLLMTYGLLTRLTMINSNADELLNGAADPAARDAMIITCLTKHGRSGAMDPGFDFDAIDVSIDDCERIFDWGMEHLLDFFMRRMEAGSRISMPYADRLQSLMSSMAGSTLSISNKDSAGPSA